MNTFIKGKSDWQDDLNENFEEVTTQLSEMMKDNLLINGDFQVWQRGTSFSIPSGTSMYTSDRINVYSSQPITVSKGASGNLEINNTTAFTDKCRVIHPIEVPSQLKGKVVTLSIQIFSSLGNRKIGLYAMNPGGTITYLLSEITISTIKKVYSVSFTMPTDQNIISLGFTMASNGVYCGLTGSTPFNVEKISVDWWKLEQGNSQTPFVSRLYGEELALCQRYYEKSYELSSLPGTNTASGRTLISKNPIDNAFYGNVSFRAIKRATPTLTLYKQDGTVETTTGIGWNTTNIEINRGASGVSAFTFQWVADSEIY